LHPSSGDRRTLRLLLEHRAHVNARDGRGHTALRHAARALQPRAVHELLRSGAEATFFGVALRTALRKLGALARAQDDAARHGASDHVEGAHDGATDHVEGAHDGATDHVGSAHDGAHERGAAEIVTKHAAVMLTKHAAEMEAEILTKHAAEMEAEILARAAQWARLLSCLARGGAPVRRKHDCT
jgi:hypothetical protein